MDQVNNSMTLDILQTMAVQTQLPKTSGKPDGGSDFRKLMDKAAGGKDAKAEETPEAARAETPAADKTGRAEEAPAETRENALERIKKMLEQNGAFAYAPSVPCVMIDQSDGEPAQVYNPGEYVLVFTGEDFEVVPTVDLEPWQRAQLDQLLINPAVIDVSDPKAEAMLKATAPDADNSPAALLERVTADRFGKVVSDTAAKAVRPEAVETVEAVEAVETVEPVERQDDDPLTELKVTDGQQAPQPLFHDVKAAPVKVGEADRAAGAEEAGAVRQVNNGVAQALEKGEPTVRIQLNPEHLGSVTVEITRSAEGVIRVALSAHTGETRSLLERHAGELQGLLGERTQQSVEVTVQRQQESQQNQNHSYDGHNGHAQDGGQQRRRQQREHSGGVDFIQQLRLGLIPADGEK